MEGKATFILAQGFLTFMHSFFMIHVFHEFFEDSFLSEELHKRITTLAFTSEVLSEQLLSQDEQEGLPFS